MGGFIQIKGATEHNLKNINLSLPHNNFIVVSGVSGSGKSSLAFDIIYAEGQRRYVESLSAYARQFLGQMPKPAVYSITGIPPALAIQQKGTGYNPRSTVGTLTEIYDYLRLLFARVGTAHCPDCGLAIKSQSTSEIVRKIMNKGLYREIIILAPIIRGRKGQFKELFERLQAEGFITLRIDNKIYSLEEEIELDSRKSHNISVVVDRLKITKSPSNTERVADSVEIALKKTNGIVEIDGLTGGIEIFSTNYACAKCGLSIGEIEPRIFSFNSPYGACKTCSGLGVRLEIDPALVLSDEKLSITEGAIIPWSDPITTRRQRWKSAARKYKFQMLNTISEELNFSLKTPYKKLPEKIKNTLLYGSEKKYYFELKTGGRTYTKHTVFEGVVSELSRRYLETQSDYVREKIQQEYMRELKCPACCGARLKKESLAVKISQKNIAQLSILSATKLKEFFKHLKLSPQKKIIADSIIREILSRIDYLINVGVEYISLNRKAITLSSGEAQRIRLATQIGSALCGVVYILDEPTVGLHSRDTNRLIKTLKQLKELGNTLIVVEHDYQTIAEADYIVDLGPAAGIEGGKVVYAGSKTKFKGIKKSLTSLYYSGNLEVPLPSKIRKPTGKKITLKGCSHFNLKNIDVHFHIGLFNCVTGVSGSGKSTLVEETLYKALMEKIYPLSTELPGKFRNIKGYKNIKRVVNIDQSPIGRTPRSNPATYTKVFNSIRELFARLPISKARGYQKGRFSFNTKEGTCQKCGGQGEIQIKMHFLPDIYIICQSCGGKKFTAATLDIKYKGKNIAEVLNMTVKEALNFFSQIPDIKRILKTLDEVGLGYIKLGQSSVTLSGGEAQRIKLARELSKKGGKGTGNTVYILDEPTIGLHPHDIKFLLAVLHSLVNKGNTVIVIEHNMDIIKNADWIIDMGPEGGLGGGEILISAPPLELLKCPNSYTGKYLKKYLSRKIK